MAPRTGPTVYTLTPTPAEPRQPARSTTSLGPRSLAGFVPAPITGPNVPTSVVTAAPIRAGAAALGTENAGSVKLKMRYVNTLVASTYAPSARRFRLNPDGGPPIGVIR
jgi:hypothetical protein